MTAIPGKMVEGVFKRLLAPDLTPQLIGQLAEAGIDVSVPAHPSYPRAAWYRAVSLTAAALFPELPEATQQRKLGAHIIHALQSRHVIKGPWLSMARLMGPRRALKQAMDFTDRSPIRMTITERSKTEFEVAVDDKEQPEFLAGLLEAAIHMLGGKSPHVALEGERGHSNLFRATWR
ncbi:MAG: DUF2378 family protein [Myxococcota bacterium]